MSNNVNESPELPAITNNTDQSADEKKSPRTEKTDFEERESKLENRERKLENRERKFEKRISTHLKLQKYYGRGRRIIDGIILISLYFLLIVTILFAVINI